VDRRTLLAWSYRTIATASSRPSKIAELVFELSVFEVDVQSMVELRYSIMMRAGVRLKAMTLDLSKVFYLGLRSVLLRVKVRFRVELILETGLGTIWNSRSYHNYIDLYTNVSDSAQDVVVIEQWDKSVESDIKHSASSDRLHVTQVTHVPEASNNFSYNATFRGCLMPIELCNSCTTVALASTLLLDLSSVICCRAFSRPKTSCIMPGPYNKYVTTRLWLQLNGNPSSLFSASPTLTSSTTLTTRATERHVPCWITVFVVVSVTPTQVNVSYYNTSQWKFVAPENNFHMQQYGLGLKLSIRLKLGLGLRVGLTSGLGLRLGLGLGLGVVTLWEFSTCNKFSTTPVFDLPTPERWKVIELTWWLW